MKKTLDDLIRYVYKKYPYPETWWAKAHFEKRCTEIYVSEQVILKCMDSPFKDPRDIIDAYRFTLIAARKDVTSIDVIKKFNIMLSTLDILYKFFGV